MITGLGPEQSPAAPAPERSEPPTEPPTPDQPEVSPPAVDPEREHVAGDEPVPVRPDPRLSVDFF